MPWLGTDFHGATVRAIDGVVGELADLLFDDRTWHVRWLVVDTGRWLNGRRLLIHPTSLLQPERGSATLRMQLTRSQVSDSPLMDTDEPITPHMERSLNHYYGHDCGRDDVAEPSHLRSLAEMEGYLVRASDDDIGFLQNVIVDDEAWCVRDLVVDVPALWSVRHAVVPAAMIERFSWPERCIGLASSRAAIDSRTSMGHGMTMGRAYRVLRRAFRDWKVHDLLSTRGA